jgi:hypothetical protein
MELDEILMKLSPGNQTWYEFSVEGLGLICFSVIKKNRLDPESTNSPLQSKIKNVGYKSDFKTNSAHQRKNCEGQRKKLNLASNILEPYSLRTFFFLNTRKPNPNREAVPFTYNYKYNCINNGQWLMNAVSSTYILTLPTRYTPYFTNTQLE